MQGDGHRLKIWLRRLFFSAAVSVGAAGAHCCASALSVNPPLTAPPPVIDGRLDEACWAQAAVITNFHLLDGAALALPHPLTILSAFVAAPITTLHPALAAGWVAGLVEAWIRPPAVADFESLPAAMESFRAFIRNPVVRILLVVVTTNLGASLGTFVAIPWIVSR